VKPRGRVKFVVGTIREEEMPARSDEAIIHSSLESMLDDIETAGRAVNGVWWDTSLHSVDVTLGQWLIFHVCKINTDCDRERITNKIVDLLGNGLAGAQPMRDINDDDLWRHLAQAAKKAKDAFSANPTCQYPSGKGECGMPLEPGRNFCRDCDAYREPASTAHNANARTGVYFGDLSDA
jgi:hypothetical protein